MVESVPTTSAQRDIYFQLSDSSEVKAHPALTPLSGFLKDYLKTVGASDEMLKIPTADIGVEEYNLLNAFVSHLAENFNTQIENEQDKKDFWMEFIPQHKDNLRSLADKVDKNLLITGANAGDFLIIPAFISFCTFFLCERCQHMKLAELREFLNEECDFDEEQLRIIRECPEFENL